MLLDLNVLRKALLQAPREETVDSSDVNPYLLNEVLQPMLAGKVLRYGEIDYSRFDADDLRTIAYYCQARSRVIAGLYSLIGGIAEAPPAACKSRVFC